MQSDTNHAGELRGMQMAGPDDEVVGEIVDVFSDQLTGSWEWAVVRPHGGGDDRHHRFVPLVEAEVEDDRLRVPYDAGQIFSAPDVGGAGHLNADDEAQLYVHYGMDPWEHGAKSGGRTGGTPTGVPLSPHTDAGPDRSATGDDGALL